MAQALTNSQIFAGNPRFVTEIDHNRDAYAAELIRGVTGLGETEDDGTPVRQNRRAYIKTCVGASALLEERLMESWQLRTQFATNEAALRKSAVNAASSVISPSFDGTITLAFCAGLETVAFYKPTWPVAVEYLFALGGGTSIPLAVDKMLRPNKYVADQRQEEVFDSIGDPRLFRDLLETQMSLEEMQLAELKARHGRMLKAGGFLGFALLGARIFLGRHLPN